MTLEQRLRAAFLWCGGAAIAIAVVQLALALVLEDDPNLWLTLTGMFVGQLCALFGAGTVLSRFLKGDDGPPLSRVRDHLSSILRAGVVAFALFAVGIVVGNAVWLDGGMAAPVAGLTGALLGLQGLVGVRIAQRILPRQSEQQHNARRTDHTEQKNRQKRKKRNRRR